ncbi:MAG: hypothetical protein ACQESE_01660 [Nanobdellota archaeon]
MKQQQKNQSWKPWIFPLSVIMVYGIISLFNSKLITSSLSKTGTIFWNLLPAFILVIILMGVTNKFLDQKRLARILGRHSGVKGTLVAIGAGIISSGAIYMWYPWLADLQQKGASWSHISMFLYNRAVKIPLLPVMISYFGTVFVIVLMVVMIAASILQGHIIEAILAKETSSQ